LKIVSKKQKVEFWAQLNTTNYLEKDKKMIYLWEMPDRPNNDTAVYNLELSPSRFLLMDGKKLDEKEFSQCDCYLRSSALELPDDPFIRMELRPADKAAYIFTPNALYYCEGGLIVKKVEISIVMLNKLKAMLPLSDEDIDKAPRTLSDKQLADIAKIANCPQFSRTPILHMERTKEYIEKKYDCIPNNSGSPLVNQKIADILLKLAPDDVQFFDTEIRCKDGVLKVINY
jgi:hypothetical protein